MRFTIIHNNNNNNNLPQTSITRRSNTQNFILPTFLLTSYFYKTIKECMEPVAINVV